MELLKTTIGQPLFLELIEHSGAGYLWTVDQELLNSGPLKVSFKRVNVDPEQIGESAQLSCKISSEAPGTFAVTLTHTRPWEPAPYEVRHYLIEVSV